MHYLISFLEGVVTFLSPCLLPMLPIYLSYFAGGRERTLKRTLLCALGFVLGFTVMFVAMGALAGTVGGFLNRHRRAVDLVSGAVVVFFGLHFLGVVKLRLFRGPRRQAEVGDLGFFFGSGVRRGVFRGLDALRGRLSGLCSGDGLPAGANAHRNAYAAVLFSGAGGAVSAQRRAHRPAEGRL